jgi:thymidine kinase
MNPTQPLQKGRLEVICGSMFSGKTEELIRRLNRAEYAKQQILTIKYHLDKRYDSSHIQIISHTGKNRSASSVGGQEGLDKILEQANNHINIVGVDEIQFFPSSMLSIITTLIDQGKRVIVAGLDLDFRGQPFGIIPTLLALADEVIKLKAICVVCGQEAHHTQRIINGRPASYQDPTILVGASECYEARCRNCFVIDKKNVMPEDAWYRKSCESGDCSNEYKSAP